MKSQTLEKFIEYCEYWGIEFPQRKAEFIDEFYKDLQKKDRNQQRAKNLARQLFYREVMINENKDIKNIINIITEYFEKNVKEWK
jgi:hypothetical protein